MILPFTDVSFLNVKYPAMIPRVDPKFGRQRIAGQAAASYLDM